MVKGGAILIDSRLVQTGSTPFSIHALTTREASSALWKMRAAIIPRTFTCLISGDWASSDKFLAKTFMVFSLILTCFELERNSRLANAAATQTALPECVQCKSALGLRSTISSRLNTAEIGRDEDIPFPKAMMSGLISAP